MARVNEVVREVLADELERLSDPRLGLVTVTGVDVSTDLRHATVYYSALVAGRDSRSVRGQRPVAEPDAATATAAIAGGVQDADQRGVRSAAPHLRTALGRQVRLKYVPELTFREDPAIEQGERVEADHPRDPFPAKTRVTGCRNDRRRRRELARAAQAIDGADVVALACHVNPDGDALGSMLGLFHVLRAARRATSSRRSRRRSSSLRTTASSPASTSSPSPRTSRPRPR